MEVKFCTAKRTQVPDGHAKFDVNRCKESPLRGEKPDFWPVSKFNTGSLPLRGILPVVSLLLWFGGYVIFVVVLDSRALSHVPTYFALNYHNIVFYGN